MSPITFVFGLAIFLLAMKSLEQGIRQVSGDGLRAWITHRTDSAIGSASSGVIVTAIMQSSSMVSLVVLALVSAGVMPLFNGLGVILGANLGTTMTGWVVTLIGFKMNFAALVVPLLGLGAAANLGYIKSHRLIGIGKIMFAFGLLVFGLDVMKESVEGLAESIDMRQFLGMHAAVYLFIGVVLAAVMQSSSAVMIIALSMINSNLIGLSEAAALIIGADLGTTSTTILGSMGESVVKKQLALGQVAFNLLVDFLAFVFLLPRVPELLLAVGIQDSMFGLVAFHSTFNILGLMVFLPLLKYYSQLIERVLPANTDTRIDYFAVPIEVPDIAIDSLELALSHLISDTVGLSCDGLQLNSDDLDLAKLNPEFKRFSKCNGSFDHCYEQLKAFEGNLLHYASRLRTIELSRDQGLRISKTVEKARSLVYACKTLKDVTNDVQQLKNFTRGSFADDLSGLHDEFMVMFFNAIAPLLFGRHSSSYVSEETDAISVRSAEHHQVADSLVTRHMSESSDVVGKVSTWFNLNHELHHYVRYMLAAAH
jgi:phosphate:Na+ symporter